MKNLILACILISLSVSGTAKPTFHKIYSSNDNNLIYSINATADSGFIMAGNNLIGFQKNIYVVKANVNGDTLWSRIFTDTTGDLEGREAFETLDGGFVIGGSNIVASMKNLLVIHR